MPKGSIAFQILPLYTPQAKSLNAIDRAIAHVEKQDQLEVTVGSFETTLEGEFSHLLKVLEEAVEIAGQDGEDIFVNVKLRYQKEGKVLSTDEKLANYTK